MSLIGQTSRDEIAIERLLITQSSTGGQVRTFSAANRGALPTATVCRIQPLSSEEQIAFGVRGARSAWKLLFSTNPALTVADRVLFTDSNAVQHVATVVQPSRDLDGQGRLYRAIVQETENER